MTAVANTRVNVAAWIFVAVAVVVALQALADGIPRHAFDTTWPDHARFHLTLGVANQVGFCLTIAAVALIPFRRCERWSWWVLLGFTLLGNLALLPAALWQGSGPRAGAEIPIGLIFLALLVALAMSAQVGFPRRGEIRNV